MPNDPGRTQPPSQLISLHHYLLPSTLPLPQCTHVHITTCSPQHMNLWCLEKQVLMVPFRASCHLTHITLPALGCTAIIGVTDCPGRDSKVSPGEQPQWDLSLAIVPQLACGLCLQSF